MTDPADSEQNKNWVRVYLGLGSNEGDRLGFIQQAMQLLKDHPRVEVVECSSLYEAEPVGSEYEQWFVNAVASIETNLSLRALFELCKHIENCLSRLRDPDSPCVIHDTPHGSLKTRIIDIDILLYGEEEIHTDYLTVPHPNLCKRAYQLVPLLEIAPNLKHPKLGKTITELHEELSTPEQVFLFGTRESTEDFC